MIKKIAATLLLSMVGFSAVAQDQGVTLAPMVGITTFDDDLESEAHYSLGLGYRFDSPWGIELVYGRSNTELDSAPGTDVDYTRYHLDALYNFGSSDSTTHYLSFGLGENEYDAKGFGTEDETMINVGAGFKHFFSDHTAFRGEIKIFHGFDENEAQAAFSLGIHHIFAMGSAPAPVVKAPQDGDRDGVLDSSDSCPRTPSGVSVDSSGCALDSDKDGVPDYKDQCPGTTDRDAVIDSKGCYVSISDVVSISLAVEFDNNSSDARPEHRTEVKRVYEFMKAYPLTKVTMEGHTDNRGEADYNKGLSKRRATTIANILINDFGIAANRVSTRGYGEEKPIASNDNLAGRQQNRRVVGVIETSVESIKKR